MALALLGGDRAFAGDESSTVGATKTHRSFPNAYLSAGAGLTSVGPMATASLSVDVGFWLFMARASTAAELTIFSPPKSEIQDYSALVGLVGRQGPMRGVHGGGGRAGEYQSPRQGAPVNRRVGYS